MEDPQQLRACPVCLAPLNCSTTPLQGYHPVECGRCGIFYIEEEAVEDNIFRRFTTRERMNVSAWLNRNPHTKISGGDAQKLKSIQTPSVLQRLDMLLQFLAERTPIVNSEVLLAPKSISATWSINDGEVRGLADLLVELDRVKHVGGQSFMIKAEGWKHLETLALDPARSNVAFVAMQFSPQMFQIYADVIAPAIRDAGYDPMTVADRQHNGKIDDVIIAEIRKCKFVVADFNGLRGGVYYEAGFAHGLGKEVVWTCPRDILEAQQIHFDVRQFNFVDWTPDDLPDFRKRLRYRIESALGRGKN